MFGLKMTAEVCALSLFLTIQKGNPFTFPLEHKVMLFLPPPVLTLPTSWWENNTEVAL